MINVAITDDQAIIINGLEKILSDKPGIKVTGTFINGDELLEGLKTAQPDVLLLDIQMPGKTGIELAGIITKKYPAIKIIALTNFEVPVQIKKMLQQGCRGYLLKDVNPDIIVTAIKKVYDGSMYIQENIQVKLMKSLTGPATAAITRREREILQLIVEEYTNKEIADKLFLSLRTVENHRNHLLQKFRVKNTAGLVKVAIQEGLL